MVDTFKPVLQQNFKRTFPQNIEGTHFLRRQFLRGSKPSFFHSNVESTIARGIPLISMQMIQIASI